MSRLNPEKLHVEIDERLESQVEKWPRRYTLTHSDATGDLFLTIGKDYDQDALSGWYTKLMRDEALGEWVDDHQLMLHIHLHVSGGLVFGTAKWRESIFKEHLPLVLEAICFGDKAFINACTTCQEAPILVHFHAKQPKLDHTETWGEVRDFLPDRK